MDEIKAECTDCGATGLYCGFAEPEGTAVICCGCGGTGCKTIRYKPFEKRKRKRGVQQIITDGGVWFARRGGEKTISVEEFYSNETN